MLCVVTFSPPNLGPVQLPPCTKVAPALHINNAHSLTTRGFQWDSIDPMSGPQITTSGGSTDRGSNFVLTSPVGPSNARSVMTSPGTRLDLPSRPFKRSQCDHVIRSSNNVVEHKRSSLEVIAPDFTPDPLGHPGILQLHPPQRQTIKYYHQIIEKPTRTHFQQLRVQLNKVAAKLSRRTQKPQQERL